MHKFKALLVLNLKAMLCSFRFGRQKKNRAVSGVGALVFLAAMALYLSGLYSFLFAVQLAELGMLSLLMMMMPVLAVAAGLLFTLFAAQGIIFGGKDNDLMLSLPVSAFQLLLARTLALYLENLIFSVFVMIPAGVAYLVYGGGGGLYFVVTLFVCALFLALLPTLLSLICGYVMAWLSSKFARKALLSTLLYFTLFGVMMAAMFRLNFLIADLAASAAGIEQSLSTWGLPFLLLEQAVCEGNLLSLLGFLALCLLPFLCVVWLFARRYNHILTGLTARGARSDYKLVRIASGSQRSALLKKESARFFGTPIYLFNAGMGLIMMLIAAVAALVMREELLGALELLQSSGVALPLMPLITVFLCFLVSTVSITASSISLEGKQLWVLKEAPVSTQSLFIVKVGFQLFLVFPCLLFSLVCLGIALSLSALQLLFIFAVTALFSLLLALFGLYINLCLPKLDASNDMVVVKQSAAALLSTFGAMGLCIAGAGLYLLVWRFVGVSGALALLGILCTLGSALLLWLLSTKGKTLFEAL